jgi:putative endonuclease
MQNKAKNKEKGDLGESIACKYLLKKGFEIIERNYWQKCGEIDIISKNKGIIHFIEVKSVSRDINTDNVTYACPPARPGARETNDYYRPEDNLHEWKLERLRKTIQVYLAEKSVSDETNWQFDVITVYFDEKRLISKVFMLEKIIL